MIGRAFNAGQRSLIKPEFTQNIVPTQLIVRSNHLSMQRYGNTQYTNLSTGCTRKFETKSQ